MFEFSHRAPLPRRDASQPLAHALQQLAREPAPFDDWTRMRDSLRQSPTHTSPKAWREFALAASLLVGLALAMLLAPTTPEPPSRAETSDSDTSYAIELDTLQRESAWLESMLRQRAELASTAPSLDAETLSARQELTGQLQWVDALLSDQPSAEVEQALWQQRVLLLRQLSIEYTPSGVALSSTTESDAAPL